MCYQDEAEAAMSLWDWEAIGTWELVPVIIPKMETALVLAKSCHKHMPILNHILSFMPIQIHTVLVSPILPSKLAQPAMGCSCHG